MDRQVSSLTSGHQRYLANKGRVNLSVGGKTGATIKKRYLPSKSSFKSLLEPGKDQRQKTRKEDLTAPLDGKRHVKKKKEGVEVKKKASAPGNAPSVRYPEAIGSGEGSRGEARSRAKR